MLVNRYRWMPAVLLFVLAAGSGCSRTQYRLRADNDAYARLYEKVACTPWELPSAYSVYPSPQSRLYDPTPVDDPCLPIPSPQLYDYVLPDLPERDVARFDPSQTDQEVTRSDSGAVERNGNSIHSPESPPDNMGGDIVSSPPMSTVTHIVSSGDSHWDQYATAAFHPNADRDLVGRAPVPSPTAKHLESMHWPTSTCDGPGYGPTQELNGIAIKPKPVRLAQVEPLEEIEPQGAKADSAGNAEPSSDEDELDASAGPRRVPIPESYWNSIPSDCLRRMLEFDSVIEEYRSTFNQVPAPEQKDDSPRLALEDIIELTLLNSRDLQSEKELLYGVALALTLERFDYQLKPSLGGNGTATNFTHDRSGGDTVNNLRIPTDFQLDRMLCTGGDFLARFANSVILTFNGPTGFAADVGSELLFDFTQSVFQRDVRFENLTQAERNVVYAARDFTRFRRALFVQQASQYYSLIRQFRQVEINSQNYFTLVREFDQRAVEYRGGFTSRIELDQIEQQVINGRRALLSTCTSLDNSLDDLKINIGLPTELPLNLDLSELNLLTLRDELAVNAELIERVRTRIETERQSEAPARATLLSAGAVLIERMLDLIRLKAELGLELPDTSVLSETQLRFQIEGVSLEADEARRELASELNESPTLTTVFQRRTDVMNELLRQIEFQIRLYAQLTDRSNLIEEETGEFQQLRQREVRLRLRFEQLLEQEQLDLLPQLVMDAESLQHELESKVASFDKAIGRGDQLQTPDEKLEQTLAQVNDLFQESESYLVSSDRGLVPVTIDMDAAMLTALVQRFDLINQRGSLADDWRQIKLAADDLKSVLNLRASQSIRTRDGVNRPFDFSFDDSTTSLGATFDLPFNRRAQRNRYRQSLFNYQSALRRLTQLEDTTKLSVRRDMRSLSLDREQYVNDVASAALAFERVVSTELELRIGSATSRDFLESQNAYVQSLSSVASRHIDYIVGRLQLFLDLESLTVGDNGFWDKLYDEHHQPEPSYQLPAYAQPAYGRLHPGLKYSAKIKRMMCVPTGTTMIGSGATPAEKYVGQDMEK